MSLDALPKRVRDAIIQVAERRRVRPADILGKRKLRPIVDACYEAMRAVAALGGANPDWPSSVLIGRWFNRDHTTVLYALNRFRRQTERGGPMNRPCTPVSTALAEGGGE